MIGCFVLLTWLKLLLFLVGFSNTNRWIRYRSEQKPAKVAASIDFVKSTEHVVALVGALYPGRAKCLEQSLALYYLLRRQGISAKYCQGVQPFPFQAHAWIEYQGEVINDVAEHVRTFTPLTEPLG